MHCVEDPIQKGLINSLRITYQSRKGNFRLVPVFPEDSVQALMLLAYPENRKVAGFSSENLFLFPSTQKSNNHASGWHIINNIPTKLDIKCAETLTATKNRHGLAQYLLLMFYEHMGHAEGINQNIYQAHSALMEILKVGRHLKSIDKSKWILKTYD